MEVFIWIAAYDLGQLMAMILRHNSQTGNDVCPCDVTAFMQSGANLLRQTIGSDFFNSLELLLNNYLH